MPDQHDQNDPNQAPIGDPKPIATKDALDLCLRIAAWAGVAAESALTFFLVATPTRVSGASRSAKLRWLQRQNEIRQQVESAVTDSQISARNQAGPASAPSDK
jgi:hypothetical protein